MPTSSTRSSAARSLRWSPRSPGRRHRRGRVPTARALAGDRRHRRPRPVRDDRRVTDPLPGRARVAHRHHCRVLGERPSRDPHPDHRRHRHQRHAATIAATRRAAELGADAALVVAPYYNRPDDRMLEGAFPSGRRRGRPADRRLQRAAPDRDERGRRDVPAARRAPRVVAVKEASGNLEQIARICRERPRDVAVLAGDDAWTLPDPGARG